MDPILTVVMPSYNSERFIAESIESILRQTFQEWELIVVDDASTDATTDIVSAYQRQDPRVRLIPQSVNRGAAHARNVALDLARGAFVAFIDSDDVWFPKKASTQVQAMERLQADISYTGWERCREGQVHTSFVSVPRQITYRAMLRRCKINCSTAMVRRSTCGTVRMPPLRLRQDHGYWLALLRDGSRTAIGINAPLISCRMRSDSLSARKIVAARYSWKLLREVEHFDLLKSLWFFSGYAFEAVRLRLYLNVRRLAKTRTQMPPNTREIP